MAQMRTKHQEMPEADRVVDAPQAAASWTNLYRGAGVAALITAVLIPVQLAVFMAHPFPETVTGWFELLQDNPLAGLVDLDLLLVVDNVLLVVIALALYMALRPTSRSMTTMATGLWLLAIAMFIASNPALQMLSLSDQFAAATSQTQRSVTVAAGQAMLASWEGTAFQVSYVVGQIAGILIGLVMLRSDRFGRAIPYTLMVGNVVGFGLYLPTVGRAISAFSGLVLWAWYLLIARRFFQLERSHPVLGIDR
jgi:F0F1-type ATP synthase assembly protein I